MLDGRGHNVYMKQQVVRHRSWALMIVLLGLLVVAFVFLSSVSEMIELNASKTIKPIALKTLSFKLLFLMSIFGGIGATFSALTSLANSTSKKIPDVIQSVLFTSMRPLIGAAAAMVVCLAEISGIINIFDNNSLPSLLTLSFIAGFSDALIMRIVGKKNKDD